MAKRLFVDMDGTLARFHDEVSYLERMWEQMLRQQSEWYNALDDLELE